jgi:hypothetical protein
VNPYAEYRREHLRAKRMLLGLRMVSTLPEQQCVMRGAAVVIFAEFEAFLREVVEDLAYSMEDPWDSLKPFQRRVIAFHAVAELGRFFSDAKVSRVSDQKDAARIARRVLAVAAWFDDPSKFSREVAPPPLGLLGDPSNVSQVLANWMGQLRDDETSFDDWLWKRGIDAKAYMQTIATLVTLRNDVAHQNRLGLQPTAEELRGHHKRLAVLARAVQAYVLEDVTAIPAG